MLWAAATLGILVLPKQHVFHLMKSNQFLQTEPNSHQQAPKEMQETPNSSFQTQTQRQSH